MHHLISTVIRATKRHIKHTKDKENLIKFAVSPYRVTITYRFAGNPDRLQLLTLLNYVEDQEKIVALAWVL